MLGGAHPSKHAQLMTPEQLLEALQLAERLFCAYKRGLIDSADDAGNLQLLRALHMFEAKFDWELNRDDRRASSESSGGGDVSLRGLAK